MAIPKAQRGQLHDDVVIENFCVAFAGLPPAGTRELVFVFSSFSKQYILVKYDFERVTIFIRDTASSFFTFHADSLARYLKGLISSTAAKKVTFIGSSKGATGALIQTGLLAPEMPEVVFNAVVFSPGCKLWPANELMEFASYKKLLHTAVQSPRYQSDLERFGDLARLIKPVGNQAITITYGEKNPRDKFQAELLLQTGATITLNPLPISNHTSIIPYIIDCSDRASIETALRSTLKRNPDEIDLLEVEGRINAEIDELHSLRNSRFDLKKFL